MASSDNNNQADTQQPQPQPEHNELDEEHLSMRPSLREDEASQLADFDRYMNHALSNPTPSASSDNPTSAPGPRPFSPSAPQTRPRTVTFAAATENAENTEPRDNTSQNQFVATSNDSPLATLTALFPTYDREALAAVLAACDGNRKAAIKMLNRSTPSISSQQPPPGSASSSPSPATVADTVRSDAQLAARLQRLETAQLRPRRSNIPVRLSPAVLGQLVASLREIVVPALRAHFQELILPDRREESPSFVYELRNLQVAALTLPAENVSVRPAVNNTTVLVNVVNANLQLEVGEWKYESLGFVPVQDSGRASVSAQGLSVALRLEARRSPGHRTKILIPQCDVTIDGIVRFKTHGAAADWAYNAIAVVFKPWVVSYIKEAVADAVVRALAVHLRQWELAMQLDEPDSDSASRPTSQTSQPPVTASE